MAIRPLGKETALLLRASALVVTPLSLVKELVDNAIDAKATSVKVQMTRNGVDRIEVQDNGVGICSDDFGALGRRAHTSKLRASQDLPRVGGTSLGFRGEALAAANSFAEVTITTRTAQEKVGHRVCLEPKGGGIKKHDLVPTPFGTTVRVQNLFASIPIRKKITTDNIQKSISDVKHLLQAYALARPGIRLSFGILGDNKSPWSYSPVGTPTVREAAFQILGKDLAAQYTNITLTEAESSPDTKLVEELTEHEVPRIVLDAFLPKQDTDLSTICKKGAFISVDGRPMAPGRGSMEKVVAAFRARFGSLHRRQGLKSSVSSVFIQLDFRCPSGSYDINVSPAKDEVLFTDESRVLKVVDSLLETHYPVSENVTPPDERDDAELDGLSPEDLQLLESFAIGNESSRGLVDPLQPSRDSSRVDLELVPRETHQTTSSPEVEETTSNPKDGTVRPDTAWLIDMSNPCDDDSVPQCTAASVIDQLRSAATQRVQNNGDKTGPKDDGDEDCPPLQAMTSEPRQDSTWPPGPYTPAANASNLPVDLRVVRSGPMLPISPSPDIPPNGVVMCTPPRTVVPSMVAALQTPPSSDGRNPRQRNVLPRFKPHTMSAPRDRQPQASRPQGRLRQGQQHAKSSNNDSFVPPYDEHQALNVLSLDSYMGPMDPRGLLSTPELGLPDSFASPPLLAVANISAEEVSRTSGLFPAASVGMNDADALSNGSHPTMDAATADEYPNQHDPRKYLRRRRRSMSRDRRERRLLRSVKSALLPLEVIPEDQEMRTVTLGISTSHADLRPAVFYLVDFDNYVSMGTFQPGLPDDLEGAADIQARLQRVCGEWAQRTTGTGWDLKLNLQGQMKGKSCG